MSSLIHRINELRKELEEFPIGDCSPSDDIDKETAYVYAFKELVKRFISSAKRLNNEELILLISELQIEPESILEAYDLKAELNGVLDFVDDLLKEKSETLTSIPSIDIKTANELSNIICSSLASESANFLHTICLNYGLKEGTREEAFKSKNQYVYSRIAHYSPNEIWKLAKKLHGKYPESGLDDLIDSIENGENLSLEATFDNIKQRIIDEISQAKFTIWVAVAWFTDRDLANALYKKSCEGVNIQIIVIDDNINQDLCSKFDSYFENYRLPANKKYKTIMHNKFCILDLEKVIHGSYNWTNKAKYNNETITISESRSIAKEFAQEFIKLKTDFKKTKKV